MAKMEAAVDPEMAEFEAALLRSQGNRIYPRGRSPSSAAR